jgi:3-keto-disaccharide hydrolase
VTSCVSSGRRFRYSAALLALAAGVAQGQSADNMELLDDGLTRWTIENTSAGNFRMTAGVLEVREPEGWLRSRRRYADFELVVEFRFMTDDADSGIFIRAVGDRAFRRGWPNQSYQVQLRNPAGESPFPPVGGLFRHGMASGPTEYDEALARQSSLPTGEWQTLTIRVQAQALSASLNGALVTRARNIGNTTGYIGIQGETGTLEFRSIRIREL